MGEIKVADVSSSDDTPADHKPDLAIDKNLATHAIVRFVDSTTTPELWMKLKLAETGLIYKIVIYQIFFSGCYDPTGRCVRTVADYQLCKDEYINTDVSVYLGEVKQRSCGTLQTTYGLEQADQVYTFICSVRGDVVMLTKSQKQLRVDEIVITGGKGSYRGIDCRA